jgi:hypothetical protein
LHLAQASKDTSIAEGTHCCLTRALGGGFCVSHLGDAKIVSGEARGWGATCQDAMRSLASAGREVTGLNYAPRPKWGCSAVSALLRTVVSDAFS